jgi:DNA polymerase-3 subunit alpha (Gram-positive type)
MKINSYISIDLETTGLNPKLDRIIEIGVVKVVDGQIVDTFETLINPGRKLEERITDLTGITDADLADKPYMEDVLPELLAFVGDELPLLGHSILFDYSFLKKAAVDRKLKFEKWGIDTLKIARKYLPELEHRSLGYLCNFYQIPHKAHRALNDAEATHLLYQRLCQEFYREEESLFDRHQLQFQVKRDTPITTPQKEQVYRLMKRHNLTVDVDVERLTRSEASRLTDQLLATCQKGEIHL